jgi:toxin CcdB
MAQFCVYRNPNPESNDRFPLMLDVQSDLIDPLHTRVVVPLGSFSAAKGRQISTLMPTFEISGKKFAMHTPQLAGVVKAKIGPKVSDLAAHREEIIAALDLLIVGF